MLVSGVWHCFWSCQNKAKTFLLLILTWRGSLYPETVRGIPSVNKECGATLVDVCSREVVTCSVPCPMSSFQSLCSRPCLMAQQLLCLLFHLLRGFLLLHMYLFPCWKSCLFLSPLPFLIVRCSMLPHNGVETLLPVTFPGVPSCFSRNILNSFWIVPHTLGCVAASSVTAVQIICSLVQKGLRSYLKVGLVSVPVSQWKQNRGGFKPNVMLICNCQWVCELDLNIYNEYLKKNLASERHAWISEGNRLKPVDMVCTSARSSRLCYSLVEKLAEI